MQSTSKREVLVYCPKCSVQNPLDEALIGTNVICKKCGHPFIAKKPKTKSSLFNNIWVWVKGLCFLVFVFLVCYSGGVPGIIRNRLNGLNRLNFRTKLNADNVLIMKYIDEYSVRFRQYGQAVRSALDIYYTQTGDELVGKKDPKKYRLAIEQSLKEAKSLHLWCEQQLKTFNPRMRTKEGETLKCMVRKAYTSYYELTAIGIELFSKTLECHQIHCGMKSDASSNDRDAFNAFLKKNTNLTEMVEALAKMDKEVMQIAEKYSSVERETTAEMKSYLNLLNKTTSQ